jgi:tRNA-specific 2-thiouridylase
MKILLGMSGGLDSTYAAHKLMSEGHAVEGAVLIMHGHTDVAAAKESAKKLGIKLHEIDCRAEFEEKVVASFVSEYLAGRTPNPCVVCNSEVKFRVLLDYATANGFDAIATGHYARIVKRKSGNGIRYAVSRAKDTKKDQTYMLWRIPQDILSHLYFPLADEEKNDIRESAREIGLSCADRDESQEICFVPDGDYASFIEERTEPSPHGFFINNEGKILGEHKGIIRYTVGQRKGLGIAMGKRVFVTDINVSQNTVTLSEEDSFADSLSVDGMVFSGIEEPRLYEKIRLAVKVRYLAKPILCKLEYLGDGKGRVELDLPVRAITPGQSAVFYDEEDLVAGGFISRN